MLVKVAFHRESTVSDHIKAALVVEVLDYVLEYGGVSQVCVTVIIVHVCIVLQYWSVAGIVRIY